MIVRIEGLATTVEMNAVLVGDNNADLQSLRKLFRAAGWELRFVKPEEVILGATPTDGRATALTALRRVGGERRDTVVLVDARWIDAASASRIVRSLWRCKVDAPIAILAPPLGHPGATASIAAALQAGADDFVLRSVVPAELALRLRALAEWRRRRHRNSVVSLGDLEVTVASRTLARDGQSVALTASEYRTFHCLARRAGRPVKRELLLRRYRPGSATSSNTLEVYILYLRRKLALLGSRCAIKTIRGVGYMLTVGCSSDVSVRDSTFRPTAGEFTSSQAHEGTRPISSGGQ